MKKLSIEQKAKRYDEAIERAKKWYNAPNVDKIPTFGNRVIEEIFPELKESEDEQHRKWILEYLYDGLLKSDEQFKGHFKAAIAWFEKQGEHAEFCNSIQVGDKVIRNEDGVLVNLSQLKRVAKKDEKQGEQKPKFRVGDTIKCKYDDRQFTIKSVNLDKGTYTYTQEGCGNDIDYADEEFELAEQKPAGSIEDETKIKSIIAFLKSPTLCAMDGNKGIIDENIKYLKSLKGRVQPQPKQEWSEEDEEKMNNLIQHLKIAYSDCEWLEKTIYFLKSLKERCTWKPSDEQMEALEHFIVYHNGSTNYAKDLEELRLQLKKLIC